MGKNLLFILGLLVGNMQCIMDRVKQVEADARKRNPFYLQNDESKLTVSYTDIRVGPCNLAFSYYLLIISHVMNCGC